MEIISDFMMSRLGSLFIMISIVVLFVSFLRFLYGPKGIFRKSLWDGIKDDEESERLNNKKKN